MFHYIYSLSYSLRFLYITFNIIFCCIFYLLPGMFEFWCLVNVTFEFTMLDQSIYRKKTYRTSADGYFWCAHAVVCSTLNENETPDEMTLDIYMWIIRVAYFQQDEKNDISILIKTVMQKKKKWCWNHTYSKL